MTSQSTPKSEGFSMEGGSGGANIVIKSGQKKFATNL